MYTLAIDTASSHSSLALFKDKQVLSCSTWLSDNDEAEKIMPGIQKMMEQNKISYQDLDNVLVVKGPGSFTGLRIGVATANTIAHLTNCNLFGISTFDYLWLTAPDNAAQLVYAGKGGVYVSRSAGEEGIMIDMPDLNEYLEKNNITKVFGDISKDQINQIDTEYIDVDIDFAKAILMVDLSSLTKQKLITPLYIKKPSITL